MKLKKIAKSNDDNPIHELGKAFKKAHDHLTGLSENKVAQSEPSAIVRSPGRPKKKLPDGEVIYTMAEPKKAKLIKPGDTVIYDCHPCKVTSVKKALPKDRPDLLIINIIHPIRGDLTNVAQREDVYFMKLVGERQAF